MVLDCCQDRLGYPELKRQAYKEFHTSRYGPDGHEAKANEVCIEAKGSGIALRQDMQVDGIPVFAYNPGKADKTQRLHMCAPLVQDGLIYWPESSRSPG